jgi:hypothetical protein
VAVEAVVLVGDADDQVREPVTVQVGRGQRATEGIATLRGALDARRALVELLVADRIETRGRAIDDDDRAGAIVGADLGFGDADREVADPIAVEVRLGRGADRGRRDSARGDRCRRGDQDARDHDDGRCRVER